MPDSTIRPRSRTTMASARRTVDSRWAITNDVRPWRSWLEVLEELVAHREHEARERQERQVFAESFARHLGLGEQARTLGDAARLIDLSTVLLPERPHTARETMRRLDGSFPSMQTREAGIRSRTPLGEVLARADEAALDHLADCLVMEREIDSAAVPPPGEARGEALIEAEG